MSRYLDFYEPFDPCSSNEEYGNCADFGINVGQPVYVVWTGFVSEEWNNPGNWSVAAVPGIADNVLIPSVPSGGSVFPVVPASGSPYNVRKLKVDPGAYLILLPGSVLNVVDN
jgi:hypothetical protein